MQWRYCSLALSHWYVHKQTPILQDLICHFEWCFHQGDMDLWESYRNAAVHTVSAAGVASLEAKTSHYMEVIMSAVVSKIISLTIVYSTVYSGADQRKHQSSASLAFVRGIHRPPVNSLHQRKMFPFDDVIMVSTATKKSGSYYVWEQHLKG